MTFLELSGKSFSHGKHNSQMSDTVNIVMFQYMLILALSVIAPPEDSLSQMSSNVKNEEIDNKEAMTFFLFLLKSAKKKRTGTLSKAR